MCKKQTAVSHSSTESEIISLDTGLRLDGIPAPDLWDLIVSFLGDTIQTPERSGIYGIIVLLERNLYGHLLAGTIMGKATRWNTVDHRKYCHVGNTAQHCRLGLFQDSDFSGGESYVLSEVEHSVASVGCARNKRQYPAVLQNLKLFLWMLVCEWMVFLFSICGMC